MDELIISLKEVVDNVKQFNQDLTDNTEIVSQLTQFKHWYYIPSFDDSDNQQQNKTAEINNIK